MSFACSDRTRRDSQRTAHSLVPGGRERAVTQGEGGRMITSGSCAGHRPNAARKNAGSKVNFARRHHPTGARGRWVARGPLLPGLYPDPGRFLAA